MRLRAFRRGDIEPLSAWLPGLARDIDCAAWDAVQALGAEDNVFVADEGGAAGVIAFEPDAPTKRAAQITLLAVDPERRRRRIGGRAALALERRIKRIADEVYVLVPARLGLALYFWLRLGYRPLTQAEAPPVDGGPAVWLVRKLR